MSLAATYPYYLANAPESPNQDLEVLDKYSGEVATRVALADDAAIDQAIARAVEATEPMAALAAYERKAVLDHCVARFGERFEGIGQQTWESQKGCHPLVIDLWIEEKGAIVEISIAPKKKQGPPLLLRGFVYVR